MKWKKATRSSNNGGNCVELASLADGAALRDSKNSGAGYLALSAEAFRKLLTEVKHGRHDL
jgi:hypothetical protein